MNVSRREALKAGGSYAAFALFRGYSDRPRKVFYAESYGAAGDGKTLDTTAVQRAINEAAAFGRGAQVLLRGGRKYLIGSIELKGTIDFHLADDAQLVLSAQREDYTGSTAIGANGAQGLRISGTGTVQARAREFMTGYDNEGEWWLPKDWRPKLFVLTGCRDLEVRDITFAEAPNWGLHLLGCEGALIDHVTVRNLLDVPNCDGIDLDHSRKVEVRNCDIRCGDDAIVVKTNREGAALGESSHISVRDCVIETQDSGVKVGTETTADVHDVRFERCKIKTSSRGLCIQLRDEGNVYNIAFEDIEFVSRYYADPWWGRGEAISFTAIARTAKTKLGSMHHISVKNVGGRAENSVRVWGSPESRVHDVALEHVDVTLGRWTRYRGGVYDNRPTTVTPPIEAHETSGFSIHHADNVALHDCTLRWLDPTQPMGKTIEQEDVTGLDVQRFKGPVTEGGRGGG